MFLTSVAKKKELPFHPMDFFEPNTETIAAWKRRNAGKFILP
jgi:DNA-damage-inducible protein J